MPTVQSGEAKQLYNTNENSWCADLVLLPSKPTRELAAVQTFTVIGMQARSGLLAA